MFISFAIVIVALLECSVGFSLKGSLPLPKLPIPGISEIVGVLSVPLIPIPTIPGLSGLKFDPLAIRDLPGFVSGWGMFNLGAEVHNVIFTLQNKKGNYREQVLQPSDLRTFEESSWDPEQKTIIVIHGYTEDGTDSPLSATKKIIVAYVQANRPENLVFVDWHELSRQVNYFKSANNTEAVGLYVAEFLVFLRNSNYVKNLEDVHIVGFSLGGHVSGIAGYYAGEFLKEKTGRISGLDPAGPGFEDASLESRLDSQDATFVDAIHTNMGKILTTFGTTFKTGDVDFYPNGGEHQPGCSLRIVGEVVGVCSHLKAPEYFSNSILGKEYWSCPCINYETFLQRSCDCIHPIKMGEFVDPNAKGEYYLTIPLGE